MGRRSGESLELAALAGAERAGTTEGKMLRRMPRVESDDSAHPQNQDVSADFTSEIKHDQRRRIQELSVTKLP